MLSFCICFVNAPPFWDLGIFVKPLTPEYLLRGLDLAGLEVLEGLGSGGEGGGGGGSRDKVLAGIVLKFILGLKVTFFFGCFLMDILDLIS